MYLHIYVYVYTTLYIVDHLNIVEACGYIIHLEENPNFLGFKEMCSVKESIQYKSACPNT